MERWATQQGAFGDSQQWQAGDFNGDGLDDFVKVFRSGALGSIDVHVSNGSSFSMERWATQQGAFGDSQQWLVGDFNGDGLDDFAKAFRSDGLASIDVHVSNGSSFNMERWATRQGAFGDPQQWQAGDFNGDGLDDFARVFNDNGLASIDVYFSNGSSFDGMIRGATRRGAFGNNQQWVTGDFNGDGRSELGKAFNDGGLANIDVHLAI